MTFAFVRTVSERAARLIAVVTQDAEAIWKVVFEEPIRQMVDAVLFLMLASATADVVDREKFVSRLAATGASASIVRDNLLAATAAVFRLFQSVTLFIFLSPCAVICAQLSTPLRRQPVFTTTPMRLIGVGFCLVQSPRLCAALSRAETCFR
jgi:hypothetical protein